MVSDQVGYQVVQVGRCCSSWQINADQSWRVSTHDSERFGYRSSEQAQAL